MEKLLLCFSVTFCLALVCGCATKPNQYPAAYRDALSRVEGVDPVPAEYVDQFFDFFSSLNNPGAADRADTLYATDLYFSDALMHTEDRAAVITHFQRMNESGMSLVITEHNRITQGQDVYLIWSMKATFRPVRKTVSSDTLGMTHLRFNEEGRVVLQQDFWDTGLGFYSKLPVVGPAVRSIGARFSSE